jgi:hypothetical protein
MANGDDNKRKDDTTQQPSSAQQPPQAIFSPSSPLTTTIPFVGGPFPEPTPGNLVARQEQLLEQRAAATEPAQKALQDAILARQGLLQAPIPAAREPRLYNVQPPPQQKFLDPMQAFANPLVILTLLGSLATRGKGLTAMKAATEAINGFHKGDAEAMGQNLENWKNATDAVIKQNNIELSRYDAALNTTRHNVGERAAKLEAIAASTGDEAKLAALRQGNIDGFIDLVEKQRQQKEKMEELQVRYGLAGPGGPVDDVAAETYFQSGKLPPNMGRGIQGSLEARAIRTRAEELHPEVPPAEWPRNWQRFNAQQVGIRKLEERASALTLVEEETKTLIPRVRELIGKVNRTKYPDLNSLLIAARTKTGNEDEIKLGVAVESLIPVYARLLKPTGTIGVTDTQNAHGILNKAWSGGQMNAALDQMELERSSARAALKAARASYLNTGKEPTDEDLVTPPATTGTTAPAATKRPSGRNPLAPVPQIKIEKVEPGTGKQSGLRSLGQIALGEREQNLRFDGMGNRVYG